MAGPLDGIRVVDCSRGIAGARLTWFLADYGADVIWVEPPGGDPWREVLAAGYSVYNRNKRSVVLDLRESASHHVMTDLLDTADVFVQSWRPGVAGRLGLDYESLHEMHPSLVCCSISGFGPGRTGGDAMPGYDDVVHAATGMMGMQMGHREGPIFLGLPQASHGAAYMGLIGVLAALYRRDEDGWGRLVETSLLDGVMAYVAQAWGYGERSSAVANLASLGIPRFVARTFECGDDEWLGVSTFGKGAFDRLMTVLDLADRVPPAENAGSMAQLSRQEFDIVYNETPGIFRAQPRDIWLRRLIEADVAVVPILRPGEIYDEPQVRHNEMVVSVRDPLLGPVQQAAPPIRFRDTPGSVRTAAPTVGQHTDEVLDQLRRRAVAPVDRPQGGPDERPLLDGVRILDLGHWYATPYSARLLAELGADVIKLEPPAGDGMRGFDRAFAAAQAGKRSIAADMKDAQLARLRTALLEWADVVQHNLRAGVADHLDLGYDSVRSVNPDVIYLDAPGWGSTGPEIARQSFAPLMSGYVGAAFELGGEFNPPIYPAANEDSGAGMLGAVALLMALLHRRRSGSGQFVELPQLNSTMTDVAHIVRRDDGSVITERPIDPLQYGRGPLRRLYLTADGWIFVMAATDADVSALSKVVTFEPADDQLLRSRQRAVEENYRIEHLLGEFFAAQETASVLADLRHAGVPAAVPATDGNRLILDDPENLRVGRVGTFDHPRFGQVREVAAPFRIDGTTIPAHRRAPELGEHTDSILTWAGYSAPEISELRARGAVS